MFAALRAFDLLQHFKDALGRVDEQALEGFAQATALDGVATRAFDFCHDFSPCRVCGWTTSSNCRKPAILAHVCMRRTFAHLLAFSYTSPAFGRGCCPGWRGRLNG